LKAVEIITGIMAFVGFFLLVGAVGTSDYMDEIGQYCSFAQLVPQMVIGILMMFPFAGVEKYIDEHYRKDDENEDL
jgi:uncharacterized membrane protein YdbT with pleckstrin-like domain